jgi:hypothetical protein
MMESAPERNKATVLEAFDTLFNKRPRRKREESVFRAGRRCCSGGRTGSCELTIRASGLIIVVSQLTQYEYGENTNGQADKAH